MQSVKVVCLKNAQNYHFQSSVHGKKSLKVVEEGIAVTIQTKTLAIKKNLTSKPQFAKLSHVFI